jgi:hypothetical protein
MQDFSKVYSSMRVISKEFCGMPDVCCKSKYRVEYKIGDRRFGVVYSGS